MTRDLLPGVTGVLALANGTVLQGIGVGATGEAVGEARFNTAMTGYGLEVAGFVAAAD